MALYSLYAETWEDSCTEDANGLRITKKNIAVATSRAVTSSQIQAGLGFRYGDIGERDTVLTNVSVLRAKTGDIDRYFDIELTYEAPSEDDSSGGGGGSNTESQKHRSIRVGYGFESLPFQHDAAGVPIMNSAWQLLRDVPMFDYVYFTLILSDRVPFAKFNTDLLTTYKDRINDRDFFGFGKGKVRLIDLGLVTGFDRGVAYCDVSLQFAIKNSWTVPIADRGKMKVDKEVPMRNFDVDISPGNLTVYPVDYLENVLDANGLPVAEPVNFNGKGVPLAKGEPVVWLPFRPMQSTDFTQLLKSLSMPLTVAEYGK